MPKEDGEGIELRKNLTSLRAKLRIITKKIKKFGNTGKIPMGAAMRVYYEHSDSSSTEQSSSEDEEIDEGGSSGSSKKGSSKKTARKKKNKNELLSTGLVYQPKFPKIITDSGSESVSDDSPKSGSSVPPRSK